MNTLLIVCFAFGLASAVGAWIAAYAMITKSDTSGTYEAPVTLTTDRPVVGSYV